MSRQIKFRIFNKKTNRWVHGPNSNPTLDGVNLFGETIAFGMLMDGVPLEERNDCVALQFTGLKDKNGKDIFEGDILDIAESKAQVEYFDAAFWSVFLDGSTTLLCNDNYILKTKVIGNIFENPELIKD